jgi:ankyrin repeat protein
VINKIRKWKGFEDFDGTNPNYLSTDPEYFVGYQPSVLAYAIEKDEIEVVKYLISIGADVNLINEGTEKSPLGTIEKAQDNSVEIAKLLIEAGANVNYIQKVEDFFTDSYIGETAIKIACINDNYELVELLLKHGADLNIKLDSPYDIPPICQLNFKSSKFIQTAKLLMQNGASIDDGNGELLRSAIYDGDVQTIEKLINLGCSSDIKFNHKDNPTPLIYLVNNSYSFDADFDYVFLELLKNTKEINAQDDQGLSLIHHVIKGLTSSGDSLEICFEKLVKHPDLDINIQDKNGDTPLVYLLKCSQVDFPPNEFQFPFLFHLVFLLKRGAKPEIKNKKEETSFSLARGYSNELESLLRVEPSKYQFSHENTIEQARAINPELENIPIVEIQDIIDKAQKEDYQYRIVDKQNFFVSNDNVNKIKFETVLKYSYKSITELLNNKKDGEQKYVWFKEGNSKIIDKGEFQREMKKYPYWLTMIFPKVFKSQEIQHLLLVLEYYKNRFDDNGMDIIAYQIINKLYKNQKQLKNNWHKIKPQQFILTLIDSYSGDAAESGNYHIYRAALSPTGQSLLKVYHQCLNEMVNLDFVTKEEADKNLKQLKENIKAVG